MQGDAACISVGFAPCLDVHQYLWDHGGSETDVNKGQGGDEEVHGGVELGVRADGQDAEMGFNLLSYSLACHL